MQIILSQTFSIATSDADKDSYNFKTARVGLKLISDCGLAALSTEPLSTRILKFSCLVGLLKFHPWH
jgi:hypothetical protein